MKTYRRATWQPCPGMGYSRCAAAGHHGNHVLQVSPSIISCSSSSVMFSPSSLATRFRFLKEILPVSSSSNRLGWKGKYQ